MCACNQPLRDNQSLHSLVSQLSVQFVRQSAETKLHRHTAAPSPSLLFHLEQEAFVAPYGSDLSSSDSDNGETPKHKQLTPAEAKAEEAERTVVEKCQVASESFLVLFRFSEEKKEKEIKKKRTESYRNLASGRAFYMCSCCV